jgi:hypothetical protein
MPEARNAPHLLLLFLAVLGFELRALHLLGKCSTTRATSPALFSFSYFSDKVLHFFCPGPHLCLLLSWDSKCVSPRPICWLRKSFTNFLPGLALNHDLPNLCLPSRCGHRHEPSCLALLHTFDQCVAGSLSELCPRRGYRSACGWGYRECCGFTVPCVPIQQNTTDSVQSLKPELHHVPSMTHLRFVALPSPQCPQGTFCQCWDVGSGSTSQKLQPVVWGMPQSVSVQGVKNSFHKVIVETEGGAIGKVLTMVLCTGLSVSYCGSLLDVSKWSWFMSPVLSTLSLILTRWESVV